MFVVFTSDQRHLYDEKITFVYHEIVHIFVLSTNLSFEK